MNPSYIFGITVAVMHSGISLQTSYMNDNVMFYTSQMTTFVIPYLASVPDFRAPTLNFCSKGRWHLGPHLRAELGTAVREQPFVLQTPLCSFGKSEEMKNHGLRLKPTLNRLWNIVDHVMEKSI